MKKTFLNPPDLPNWQEVFSQVVTVKSTDTTTVFVAGQVSVDSQRQLIGAGDLAVQAEHAFGNLLKALSAAGASAVDVVKINIYVKTYKPEDAAIVRTAFRRAFPHENLPASTWLGVEALAEEGFLIEVDAVACVSREENTK